MAFESISLVENEACKEQKKKRYTVKKEKSQQTKNEKEMRYFYTSYYTCIHMIYNTTSRKYSKIYLNKII